MYFDKFQILIRDSFKANCVGFKISYEYQPVYVWSE